MLKIALRNIFRNWRRSILSFTLIGLGGAILFLVNGYIADSLTGMEIGLAGSFGHLQIADTGYWDRSEEPAEYLLLPDRLARLEGILGAETDVVTWTRELEFSGLVGRGEKTAMLIGTGIEVGNMTTDPMDPMVSTGLPLQAGETKSILLGRRLAEKLNVEPGDRVNVAGFTVTESLNAMTVGVSGAFKYYSAQWEEQLAFVPLDLAQSLLRTGGVDKVVVRLTGLEAVSPSVASLQAAIDQARLGLWVRPWQEIAPFYTEMTSFYDALDGLSTIGVFALAFFGIMQVLTMSFMERTREVGTIRAVGTKRHQVFRLFMTEGLLLGVLGGVFGVALGFGLGAAVNAAGLGWMYPGAAEPAPVGIQLTLPNAAGPMLVAVLSALFSAIYPALHAARSNVVKALRYV